METALSIYLHIPFCRHRCAYCDFNTYTGLADLQHEYALAMGREVDQVRGLAQATGAAPTVQTLFFGGGTPSLMAPDDLAHILARVRAGFEIEADAEVTMEANPGTVDSDYLRRVRELGVNRLSFGVQSANQAELSFLEREHDFDTAVTALEVSRRAGFDNLNVDLIYGLPGQSLDSWQSSVESVLALRPEHISLYCLTIEPGTPLHRQLHAGEFRAPDPDLAADQYKLACELLDGAGYTHYEISNWALPGRACRHNLTYWRNNAYLGLGAGAHGHAGGFRYAVVRQPRTYIRRLRGEPTGPYPLSSAVAEQHRVSQDEAMSDTMITQLRLLGEGVDLAAFDSRFGQTVRQVYGETVDQLISWGLLEEEAGRLLLTRAGWFVSNQVFYRFL